MLGPSGEAAPPRGSGSGLWPRSVPPRPWGSCSCIFEMARFQLGVRVIGLSDSETSLFPRRMELCFWFQGRKAPQNLGSFCAFRRAQKDTRLERLCGQLGPQHHLPQASWGAGWPCSPSKGPRLEKRAVAAQGSVFRSKGRTGGAGARQPSPRAPRPCSGYHGLVLAGRQLPQPAAPWPEQTLRFCLHPRRPGSWARGSAS